MTSRKKPPAAPPVYRPQSAPKAVQPDFLPGVGQGDDTFASFMTFHSDPQNFNTGELKQYVEYIYEK